MSRATSILGKNYTAYPNELIRNKNNLMTKNERHLMIFLWDRLYGYTYPKHELSYSLILQDCKDFPKNNKKLSEAIQGLERKGLLKVFRTHEKTNKYYIGEKQYKCLQWYGDNFKGWKNGEIEMPQELTDIEETEILPENKPQEKTPFEEITEIEVQQEQQRIRPKRRLIEAEQIQEPTKEEIQNLLSVF